MKVQVNSKALCASLYKLLPAVETKITIPILGFVKVEAGKADIKLQCTDLEIAITDRIAADVTQEGTVCVSAKKLYDLARSLGEVPLIIAKEGQRLAISGGGARLKLPTLETEKFPEVPALPQLTQLVNSSVFFKNINLAAKAVSDAESRFTMNAVLLQSSGQEINLVGTDGHRLAKAIISSDVIVEKSLLPKRFVKVLSNSVEEDTMLHYATDSNHVYMQSGTITICCRKIAGNFPQWEKVIPSHSLKAVIETDKCLSALNRVRLMYGNKVDVPAASFKLTGNVLTVMCPNIDSGELEESISVTDTNSADAIEFKLNANYVADFLQAIKSSTFVLSWKDSNSGFVLEADNCTYIVMPLR